MEGGKPATGARKVMVIADATRESAAALQYTLSHAILENDSLILLYVGNHHFWNKKNTFSFFKKPGPNNNNNNNNSPNNVASTTREHSGGGGNSGGGGVDLNFLEEMKKACKKFQPQIEVTIEMVGMNGKDKANVILSQCEERGIDLLVIGQRRTLSSAILGKQKQKRSTSIRGDTAEYLIENCKCTCVAVHKKGQNAGYLLNTKTHRDFWLLA